MSASGNVTWRPLASASLAIVVGACGPPPSDVTEPVSDASPMSIDTFVSAASYLPPSPLGLAWVDVDALRTGPASSLLEELPRHATILDGTQTNFFTDNISSIHTVAGGIWLTMTGQAILLVLDTDLEAQELFGQVKQWAQQKGTPATMVKVRGRPALRTGDSVLVDMGEGMYINGPAGLAGRVLDLADRKVTGDALDAQIEYLARETVPEDAVLAVTALTPPSSTDWLTSKHLPSVVGSRFMLAVSTPQAVSMRLGMLPGKPIKPIWFAQEVNTFLVRAAKDDGVVKLGLAQWVESLEVELLAEGIVVKGSLEVDRLSEVLGSLGGEK